eukprot:4441389-Lingulodinium_polyedra.AAC.1
MSTMPSPDQAREEFVPRGERVDSRQVAGGPTLRTARRSALIIWWPSWRALRRTARRVVD